MTFHANEIASCSIRMLLVRWLAVDNRNEGKLSFRSNVPDFTEPRSTFPFMGAQYLLNRRKRREGFIGTTCLLLVTFVAYSVIVSTSLHFRILVKTKQVSRTPPRSNPSSSPLIVYRAAGDGIKACVIPRLCSVEPLINAGVQFYVPAEYRPFANALRDCLQATVSFYEGQRPTYPDVSTYDVDMVGRSIVPSWHYHFPHFAQFFIFKVLAPIALFLDPSTGLPSPSCLYPGKIDATTCFHGEHTRLKPRILLSNATFNEKWNNGLLALLRKAGTRVHVVPDDNRGLNTSRMECYRAGLMSRGAYDGENTAHQYLFRAAGVQHTPDCGQPMDDTQRKMHIILVLRRRGMHRSVDEESIRALKEELPKYTNATLEWVRDLGKFTFREQLRLFQRADVLVSVHGAELSNVLFLRRGARVVEITPFGFNSPHFSIIAPLVHVRIRKFPSYPDVATVERCLLQYPDANKNNSLGLKFHALVLEFRQVSGWQNQSQVALTMSEGRLGFCARDQKINFNATQLAQVVATQARERCSG